MSPAVRYLDVRKGLPIADGSADACFSSHVIEHLSQSSARRFLVEQRRVLKPGGILRVVCPDLAEICGTYLHEYSQSRDTGSPTFRHRHLVAELIDQMVRAKPGGELAVLWSEMDSTERTWATARIGYVAAVKQGNPSRPASRYIKTFISHVSTPYGRRFLRNKFQSIALQACAALLGGRKLAANVRDGLFRATGENHLWMWDEITLGHMLNQVGFERVVRRALGESDIPGWEHYGLEIREGVPIKPHSLVLEARKSASPVRS